MPRRMPRFDLEFARETDSAKDIVLAGERARVTNRTDWTPKRLEFLYALAYLRAFVAWEAALESIFLRSLCGVASSAGQEVLRVGKYYRTLPAADNAVLASESKGSRPNTYMLWHSPF